MQRVTSLDASMLYAETREMPMHTMGVMVLEPARDEAPFTAMRRRFEERMHLLAPLRRRLVQGPLELGDPHWIEDPEFTLDRHLRRAAIPSPGSMRELADFVGDLAGRVLERSKPLWEVVMVEGVEHERVAIVAKVHHAALDGGQVVALLLGCLLDTTPEGRAIPPPQEAWVPDEEPSLAWLAADAVRSLAARPLQAIRAIGDALGTLTQQSLALRRRPGDAARLFEAPATIMNGALTPHRSVAFADVAFADLVSIKRAFDTTINDVVLAASCEAVRSWLLERGGLPDAPLVVNVPVAVRGEGEDENDGGNRVSMILVHLPVQIDDPVERLEAIRAETRRAKADHVRAHGDVLRQFSSVLTHVTVPWLLTHVMELYSSAHLADHLPSPWNLVVSNLPGPTVPLYCGAARVLRVYPLGPVQQGSGLNITVLSTLDRMCFGAMACSELVPGVDEIATGFASAVEALKELAERRG